MRHPLIAAVLAILAAACSTGAGAAETDPVVVFEAADRTPLPAIGGRTIDGEDLALADLDGPVVVNFWASWCGPCKEETPHLNAVATQYADRGVSVVGVNTRDPDLVNAQTFAHANGLAFPSLFDPDQAIAAQFGDRGPVGMPTTLILDADHRVAVRFFGAVTGARLAPYLEQVLAE